jgi:DNA polymerase III sliding clamp (beta) subunit (PCNA family)
MAEKIEKADFVKSLDRVSPAIGVNVLVPAFQCFQFGDGFVTATDGVIVIKSKCESGGLESTVPGPQFLSLVKSLGGKTISIEAEGENVIVKSARGAVKGTFATVTRTDLPPIPECEMVESEDNFARLVDGLNFCRYSVSKDETTGPRCGVRVEGTKCFSTDKFRIARYNVEVDHFGTPFTVPLKYANVLIKYKKSIRKMGLHKDTHLVVELEDGTILYSSLLGGEYRDLNPFFPSEDAEFKSIEFPEALHPVLERHIAFLKDVETMGMVMTVSIVGDKCSFKSVDSELGVLEEELDLSTPVDVDLVFPINPIFWRDVSLKCSEFKYTGTKENDDELILFITEDLAYLCRPDRKPGV